jgi:hypothetical protein
VTDEETSLAGRRSWLIGSCVRSMAGDFEFCTIGMGLGSAKLESDVGWDTGIPRRLLNDLFEFRERTGTEILGV